MSLLRLPLFTACGSALPRMWMRSSRGALEERVLSIAVQRSDDIWSEQRIGGLVRWAPAENLSWLLAGYGAGVEGSGRGLAGTDIDLSERSWGAAARGDWVEACQLLWEDATGPGELG